MKMKEGGEEMEKALEKYLNCSEAQKMPQTAAAIKALADELKKLKKAKTNNKKKK